MRLTTTSVQPGDWIVVEGAAPNVSDLSPQYITLNGKDYSAYVDAKDLILRCPDLSDRATIDVAYKGIALGKVQILR